MTNEERFRNMVRGLLQLGIFPSPTAINTLRGKQGKMNVLGTDHARWRREELEAAGFARKGPSCGKRAKHPTRNPDNPIYSHPGLTICRACGKVKRFGAA